VAAFYAKRFRKTFLLLGLLFYLLSTNYVGTKLIEPLEHRYPPFDQLDQKADAVVVLGGGNNLGVPNLPLDPGAFKRFLYGLMLAKKYNLPLIYSGGFKDADAAEATAGEIAESLGIAIETPTTFQHRFVLYFERRSRDTYQNALFTKRMLNTFGMQNPKLILVTSAFHMPRAKLLFDKVGLDTRPAPTDYKAASLVHFRFFPSIKGLKLTYFAMHEYVGYLRYLLKN